MCEGGGVGISGRGVGSIGNYENAAWRRRHGMCSARNDALGHFLEARRFMRARLPDTKKDRSKNMGTHINRLREI